jgi:hypothetical protein
LRADLRGCVRGSGALRGLNRSAVLSLARNRPTRLAIPRQAW